MSTPAEKSRPASYYESAIAAMDDVAALPMDPGFLEASQQRRFRQEIEWVDPGAASEHLLLSRQVLFDALSSPLLRGELADKKAPYVTISAPRISLSLTKEHPVVAGSLIIDHRETYLTTLLSGEVTLSYTDGAIGTMTPHDLKNILFCMILSKAQEGGSQQPAFITFWTKQATWRANGTSWPIRSVRWAISQVSQR